ncbi:FMN-binding glutamate synthase family protein [Oceanidesulfovibrio indonesiensis]|uniref:FMN-binding glutamate synthase family protein n=1 Tax=Oceanidesulfovibrio indonesiensis TaxID=54767 RepID=A0A7M3MGY2_9BACT|nr:glutamate synthase-related protein [Oceanidesulfovibrio indonesiensis]TVM18357.1 FMN-binding glutamate synthase family protein [Oceanidesulfovibrio indonesiensis]
MQKRSKGNDVIGTINRGTACESSLCTLCRADCAGKCETWMSSLQGRSMLYPRDYGLVTAGSDNVSHVDVSYNSLRIQGNLYGAQGLPADTSSNADNCLFTNVSLETSFGNGKKTKVRLPLMTGALGSTLIAARYWDSFAIGCALVGIPVVIGENVVGVDREAEIENGRISKAPEMDRRINTYKRYYDGYGAVIVQLNVEDACNGVAEYILEKHGDDMMIELKWGQGAKNIGGEIKVGSVEYAKFLKERGYLVDPDPDLPAVQKAFADGSIDCFARHSRLGFTEQGGWEAVCADFHAAVQKLRDLGFKRISLKTGCYGMEGLALAIRLSAEAGLDLLTIDGAGGGTGMSPWNMMEAWGVPSVMLHAKAYEYAALLAAKGMRPADMSFAGGIAREDQIFKALALGAPYSKLICMGRALMIPGFLGANIEGALYPERKDTVHGNWDKLPATVKSFGDTPEKIFSCYQEVSDKIGAEAMKEIPLGAVAMWCLADKLGAGLQQFLAGVRKFRIDSISREDIFSGNRETERETGIPFCTDAQDQIARKILLS